jgi:hypothetical protein
MNQSTHILAPINKDTYKLGKDSGAIYDVFTYNKLGIFDINYFYTNNLIEMDILLLFDGKKELSAMMDSIIKKEFDYNMISSSFYKFKDFGAINSWVKYINTEVIKMIHAGS